MAEKGQPNMLRNTTRCPSHPLGGRLLSVPLLGVGEWSMCSCIYYEIP